MEILNTMYTENGLATRSLHASVSAPKSMFGSVRGSQPTRGDTVDSTMLEKEKRRLDKLQKKQQQEIQQMVAFEMKMTRLQVYLSSIYIVFLYRY